MNKGLLIAIVIVIVAGGAYYMTHLSDHTEKPIIDGAGNAALPAVPNDTTVPLAPVAPVSAESVPAKPMAAAEKTFTVTGSNFAFSPATLWVNKGDKVTIIFKNSGGTHDLKIDEFTAATPRIRSGEEATIEFVAEKAGTFQYYCSVGEHRQMGMVGTLTVK